MLDIELLVASIEAFRSSTARADRAQLLAHIRDQLEQLRVADEKSQAELRQLYQWASRSSIRASDPDGATPAPREQERAAAEMLFPRILSLQRYLTGTSLNDDPETHELLQKAINIATGYFAGYQNLRDRLIRFDAERRATAELVLRARPEPGEIDYEELSREHIARYPKIRDALAA